MTRFEREQAQYMDETTIKRKYIITKLNIKDDSVTDEELLRHLLDEKEKLLIKYSLLGTIVPDQDF